MDTSRPDLPAMLFVGPEHVTRFVDTSGEAGFAPGWREVQGGAPLKECPLC